MGEGFELPDAYGCLPLSVLGHGTKQLLSHHLEPTSDFVTDEGLTKDIFGLAELAGFDSVFTRYLETRSNKTQTVLDSWTGRRSGTLGNLILYLHRIERSDVVFEIRKGILKDVKNWLQRSSDTTTDGGHPGNEIPQNIPIEPTATQDLKFLTLDDAENRNITYYNACICCADEDLDLARKIASQYKSRDVKFFISQDQNLSGKYEYESTAEIIEERCNSRLVVIMSRDYVSSPAAIFSTQFVKSIDPDARQRKIIPIIKDEDVASYPRVLRGITAIKLRRYNFGERFWKLLSTSLAVQMPDLPTSSDSHGGCKSENSKSIDMNLKGKVNDRESQSQCKSIDSNIKGNKIDNTVFKQNISEAEACFVKHTEPKLQYSFQANISSHSVISQISCDENNSFDVTSFRYSTQFSSDENTCDERLRSDSVISAESVIENDAIPHWLSQSELKRNMEHENNSKSINDKVLNLPQSDSADVTKYYDDRDIEKCDDATTDSSAASLPENKKSSRNSLLNGLLKTFKRARKRSNVTLKGSESHSSLPLEFSEKPDSLDRKAKTSPHLSQSRSLQTFSDLKKHLMKSRSKSVVSTSSVSKKSLNIETDTFSAIQNEYCFADNAK